MNMNHAIVKDDMTERLARQIERLVGGRVTMLDRQPRWRTSWYAEVSRDDRTIPLYVRGDKGIDAETFPGLAREAGILRLLEQGGIPVPHVYGMSHDPEGIIMDRVPGTRDVTEAANAAEAQRIAEESVEILARIHSLDTAPFVAAGVVQPQSPREIAFSYLTPNIAIFRRLKKTPQPMMEWALRWVERNVPQHRTRTCVLHGDPGQFLFQNGKITTLYDFEATHIGDPMHDLAALRLRHPTEPLGADPNHLVRHYARTTGMEIDQKAFSYHTATFMLASSMTLAAPMANPGPVDMQYEYIVWDILCRRALLWAIAEHMDVTIPTSAPSEPADSRSRIVWEILEATVARIDTGNSELGENDRCSAEKLVKWARAEAAMRQEHGAADLDRAAAFLGYRPADWREADAAVENFVQTAGPDHDAILLDYFARQVDDRMAEALPARERLTQYALQPFVP